MRPRFPAFVCASGLMHIAMCTSRAENILRTARPDRAAHRKARMLPQLLSIPMTLTGTAVMVWTMLGLASVLAMPPGWAIIGGWFLGVVGMWLAFSNRRSENRLIKRGMVSYERSTSRD